MTSSADEPSPEDRVPRLSVVIPAWNAAASIERSVRSVLEERVVPLECVVVDDGSTDATWDVIERLRADDPRVVALRLAENGGVSNARNVALEAARGEWLAFHDADDRMLPGGIAALMQATADPDVHAVVGQRIWTDGTRSWLSKPYDIPDIREPGRKSIAANPGLMYYASATGKVFHRSLLDGLAFHGRLLGDQAWTIRALLRARDGIDVIGDTVFEWFRPAKDGPAEGITATSRSSARGASEIARMAQVVFGEVAAEVDATIEEQPTRSRIKHVYFGRLVRSDVSGQMVKAVERRDPDTSHPFGAAADRGGQWARVGDAPPAAAASMAVGQPAGEGGLLADDGCGRRHRAQRPPSPAGAVVHEAGLRAGVHGEHGGPAAGRRLPVTAQPCGGRTRSHPPDVMAHPVDRRERRRSCAYWCHRRQ
jgi:Glycosyl transferase family 2